MSCILRISGEELDVDSLISKLALPFDSSWKKGEPRILKGKYHSESGIQFVVSGADLDEFPQQLDDATEYLEVNAQALAKIISFPGVRDAVLDFGVAILEGYVSQQSYLPPRFVKIAAEIGIGIQISHYACSE